MQENQENQFVLRPKGILDRSSAVGLVERMKEHAGGPLLVDCAGIEAALHEGSIEIVKAVQNWQGRECRFENLPQTLAVRFQLAGIPVGHRAVWIVPDEPALEATAVPIADAGPADSKAPDQIVFPCRSCETPLRVSGAGLFACPECGAHFHADLRGRSVMHEPLARLD